MSTTNATTRGLRALVGLGMGLGLGCLVARPDPNHCANLEGDRTCAERYPGELAFCTACVFTPANDGCVAERPEDDACYSPCGDGTRLDEEASCLGGMSSSSGDEGTTTGEATIGESDTGSSGSGSSTTGPMPCASDQECTDVAAPFCEPVSGECVACDGTADPDGACAGADPGLPLCLGGTCVQCTVAAPEACMGKTPVCDDASNTCVPCSAHAQCAGGAACNLYIGACLPAGRVFHIGGAAPDFPDLTMAVAEIDPGTEATLIVHPGMPDYNEAVTVDGGRVVAFLAAEIGPGVEPPRWVLTSGGSAQLTVTVGSTMLMDGLQLSSNADDVGLRVDGGRAWADRSRIVQNTGGGIVAENGGELRLRNCFVGGSNDDVNALEVNDATANVLYTTLGSGTFNASALACTAPITVDVRNSILVTRGGTPPDEVSCGTATITYSATEGVVVGEGNVTVGMFPGASPGDWFMDYTTGNFGLQNDGLTLFADVAQWTTGDPPIDIDGDPRPNLDGSPDYAGADIP